MKRESNVMVRMNETEAHLFNRACGAVGKKKAEMAHMLCIAYCEAFRKSDKATGYKPSYPPQVAMVCEKRVKEDRFGPWSDGSPLQETP